MRRTSVRSDPARWEYRKGDRPSVRNDLAEKRLQEQTSGHEDFEYGRLAVYIHERVYDGYYYEEARKMIEV